MIEGSKAGFICGPELTNEKKDKGKKNIGWNIWIYINGKEGSYFLYYR